MNMDNKTFKDIVNDPTGTVYIDYYEGGLRVIILRGPCSLCAYIGVSENHPLAGHHYDDVPIEAAHGGLTYGRSGDGRYLQVGYWWYGWDYCHSGDKMLDFPQFANNYPGVEWDVSAV